METAEHIDATLMLVGLDADERAQFLEAVLSQDEAPLTALAALARNYAQLHNPTVTA